ncbi:3beta-hydroxysteroid-dehydrogenase/decarboxylase [Amborella trichopoda]|uniref:Reticulon-like protein n=1 Tax=Amborella trichopoda TaxID=13333 RepID=W1P6F6_AMBTC|nr:3beta-hydroxysteroid-dehydrogenase/decarboxylase [Amborella trichopoda]ERN05467.1 hypothetical protein AMTR_s00007p00249450 [Amborella trichopoda]|eukprot:XP_006843792.1 3beta-hydroxysteroid-dehydrogenase/decarboxylase [Amborella trichopoda]
MEGLCCVVTGGRGFAARHLVSMLLASPKWYLLRIADLPTSIQFDDGEEDSILGQSLRSGRALYISMDLCDKAQVLQACQGADVVFHMAAPNSSINNYLLHYSVNVQGTKNVIDACVECKVKRLIYTSSPSVVFDGIHGIHNGDESLPYPDKHNDHYSATKAEGEALVLNANGKEGLLTCCIRPSSIFGPGDRLLVPSLVASARSGKSKFLIGDGNNMYDFTYVENVAHAHICAEQALHSLRRSEETAAGKAYFITNMEAIKFWEFMSLILEGLGYERPKIKVPASVVMPIAHILEWMYGKLGRYGMSVPQVTPSRVRLLTCNRTFNCSRANTLLGYTPIVPLEEGLKRTLESYPNLRAEHKAERTSSKASMLLGGGWAADILLWKDVKQTLGILLSFFLFYFYFFPSGSTFITAVSKLFLAMAVFLFIHGLLPSSVLGYKIEKLQASSFHSSEELTRQIAASIVCTWNSMVGILKSLSRGKDWLLFFKVVIILSILNIMGRVSMRSLLGTGIPTMFVIFYIYDKKEEQIDGLVQKAMAYVLRLKTDLTFKFYAARKQS